MGRTFMARVKKSKQKTLAREKCKRDILQMSDVISVASTGCEVFPLRKALHSASILP